MNKNSRILHIYRPQKKLFSRVSGGVGDCVSSDDHQVSLTGKWYVQGVSMPRRERGEYVWGGGEYV